MSFQYSVALRTAQCDAINTELGAGGVVRIYSGSEPANCAATATGTLLCEMDLTGNAFAAASGGAISKTGTWEDVGTAGAGAGTDAGYFRILKSGGTVCVIQGNITGTGGGGDMELNNISIATGQTVTVTSCTITRGNA